MDGHWNEEQIYSIIDWARDKQSNQNMPEDMGLGSRVNSSENERSQDHDDYKLQKADVEKQIPTGLSDQGLEHQGPPQQSHIIQTSNQQRMTQPCCRDISYPQTSQITLQNIKTSKKGQSYQTQNIGKHLKSITVSFLSMLNQAKLISSLEKQSANSFSLSNGSIRDFEHLFQCGELRSICFEFYSSKNFIEWVMRSAKMDFYSKMMMIKYAQKLRSLTYRETKGWKLQ